MHGHVNWFGDEAPKPGQRVICIAAIVNPGPVEKLYSLGYGTYLEKAVPDATIYPFLHSVGYETSIIRLDSGEEVYSFECIWMAPELLVQVQATFGTHTTLEEVTLSETRPKFTDYIPKMIVKNLDDMLDLWTQAKSMMMAQLLEGTMQPSDLDIPSTKPDSEPEGGLLN